MITMFPIAHWDQKSIGKVYRPREGVSRYAQTFQSGDRNLQQVPTVCGGLELKTSN